MKGKSGIRVLRLIILIVVLLCSFFALRYYFTHRESVTYTAPLTPVNAIKPYKGDIKQSIKVTSYIESEKMVPVIPFVSGTITSYEIDEGSYVEKDQILAEIDSEIYALQACQADAQAQLYESTYLRIENLYNSNAVSLQELEAVRAQRDASAAQKALADLQLSYASVKAPVSGTVISSKGTEGSVASSSDYLAIIADLDNLIVNLNISERYYDSIVNGLDSLEIVVTDSERNISSTARVRSYAPYIDPLSRSFSLKIRLDNPSLFTLGSAVKVEIIYEKASDIYILPSSVLRLDGALYYVEDGRARLLDYEPDISNDEYIKAPPGMEDALFIIEGQNSLFDSQSVRVLGGES